MITIYHHPSTRSFRVVWMAEEMGLPYQVKAESMVRRSAELTAINPVGALPTVVDGDLVLTESAAVLQLLGERHGPTTLVPAKDDRAYPAFLEALHYGESSLAAFLTPLVHTRFLAPEDERDNWTATRLADMFCQRLAFAEQRLAGGPFITGDTFTAADICIGYALRFGAAFGLLDRYPPAVTAYWVALQDRPAYQRALAAG